MNWEAQWTRPRRGAWIRDGLPYWVEHCGHPTALWPYSICHPDHRLPITSPSGHAFQYLRDAMAAAELLAAGVLILRRFETEGGIRCAAHGSPPECYVAAVRLIGQHIANTLPEPRRKMSTYDPRRAKRENTGRFANRKKTGKSGSNS